MLIFITGATGYIGRAVTERMKTAGHQVSGLARSAEAVRKLEELGAEPVRGSLSDQEALAKAARGADAVVHLGMEFSADAAALDRISVESILAGLGRSDKPFIYTSGIWVAGNTGDGPADEQSPPNPTPLVAWRPAHEQMVLRAPGVRGIVIRPAMVYGRGGGAVGGFVRQAREQGFVQYTGDGNNRWPFVHVDDLADLYVLALQAPAGSLYYAAAGPSIPVKQVAGAAAAAYGAKVEGVPLETARGKLGPLADAVTLDQVISAEKARRELGWSPSRPSVLEEIAGK